MPKMLNKIKSKKANTTKMTKIGWKYTLSFITSLCFLVIMGTFAFYNQPVYIRFRLMTPELIVAIVFFVLLIGSTIIQARLLLKIEKKIHWLDFSVMILSLLGFFLNVLVIVAAPLAVIAFVKQAASNKMKLKITVFGFLGFLLTPIVAFVIMIIWGSAAQLDAHETKSFTIQDKTAGNKTLAQDLKTNPDKVFTTYSWNVGYGSTGSEMDYFYDVSDSGKAGSMGKSQNKAQVLDHLDGITQFVDQIVKPGGGVVNSPLDITRLPDDADYDTAHESLLTRTNVDPKTRTAYPITDTVKLPQADFGIFQEVDRPSVRSMYTDQPKILSSHLGNYRSEFSRNMKDGLLPSPFMDPGGQVEAGEFSFSHYQMKDAHRVGLNSQGTGVDGIFNLKRAIGLTEYALPNGGTLHIGDLHMSAFPEDTVKRNKEFNTLIAKLKEWTANPNDRVIIGGDWNTDLTEQYYYKKAEDALANSEDTSTAEALKPLFGAPFTNLQELNTYDIAKYPKPFDTFIRNDSSWKQGIDRDLIHPSMRMTGTKWTGWDTSNKDQDTAIIDGFLVSKGIEIEHTQTIQQGWHPNASNKDHPFLFADSDHNPVMMQFKIK